MRHGQISEGMKEAAGQGSRPVSGSPSFKIARKNKGRKLPIHSFNKPGSGQLLLGRPCGASAGLGGIRLNEKIGPALLEFLFCARDSV